MSALGETMNDLSKGYVPVVIVCAMLATAAATGAWLNSNATKIGNLAGDITTLQQQVNALSATVASLNLTLAKGIPLPENVAYKADILRFCLENRELKCPQL